MIWDSKAALYLVRPDYNYGVTGNLKGVDVLRLAAPTDRFWNVYDWYLKFSTDPADKGA